MPTPLDSFIETLQTRHTQEEKPSCFSLPAHTHTSEGFPCSNAGMECETKCEGPLTLPEASIQLGSRITWEGADLTVRHGVVEFLHTDPAGAVWAFVTLPNGWAAVNLSYLTRSEGT